MNNKMANTIRFKRKNPNDVIYTPKEVAEKMIELCDIKPTDRVLDPCRGGGVFYDNLPPCDKDWCEISEDKDFFSVSGHYDLIIGNPPYSIWNKWIKHTIEHCDKFCYVMGVYNLTPPRMQWMEDAGFIITKFHLIKVDWWFSPCFVVLYEKQDSELTKKAVMTYTRHRILCDICNRRCMRGRTQTIGGVKYKWGMNDCSNYFDGRTNTWEKKNPRDYFKLPDKK